MNCSEAFPVACLSLAQAVVTVASMLTVMLIIVMGNALVVITVYRDRKLRLQRQNWLIVSLAVADLLVGLLIMPLTLIYEVLGEWRLGDVLCEMWLALDVLFVTASILHICAISLDRYFSVTSPLSYPSKRTPTRMFVYIGVSWLVSLLISLPPLVGWRHERGYGDCSVSTDVGYVMYSSLGSFYIPVIILIAVYAKIYSITVKHSRQRLKETERRDKTLAQLGTKQRGVSRYDSLLKNYFLATKQMVELELLEDNSDPLDDRKESKEAINQVCWQLRKISHEVSSLPRPKDELLNEEPNKASRCEEAVQKAACVEKRRRKLKAKERQATLLLGVILSAFILSWLPFFVMYVIGAFGYEAPTVVFKFFFWLGYCNSAINPIIYTVFNREFKRGLCRQLRKFEQFVRPVSHLYK